MTFCPNCGVRLQPGGSVCLRCGKKTGPAAPPPQSYPPLQPYQLPHQIYPVQAPAYLPYTPQPADPVYQRPGVPGEPGTNPLAVLGFVLALLPLPFAGLVLCVVGLIQCGQVGPDGRRQKGRGLAVAGIVIRVVGAALLMIGVVAALWYFADTGFYLPDYWEWDEGFAFTLLSMMG